MAKKEELTPCEYNDAVMCPAGSDCRKCGWNPEVADRRLRKAIEELNKKPRPRVYDVIHGLNERGMAAFLVTWLEKVSPGISLELTREQMLENLRKEFDDEDQQE